MVFKSIIFHYYTIKQYIYLNFLRVYLSRWINNEAINIIRNFSSKVGFNFTFAISIGSGGFIDATKNIPIFSKNMRNINSALERIKNDIYDQYEKQFCDDIMLKPSSPRWLVLFFQVEVGIH